MDRTSPNSSVGSPAWRRPVLRRAALLAPALLAGLLGCGIVPRSKFDRSRNYNSDLQSRLDASESRAAQLRRDRERLEQRVARLEEIAAGQRKVRDILNERYETLVAENRRLRGEVTGAVMRAAGAIPEGPSGVVAVSATSYRGFELPGELIGRLRGFAEKFEGVEFDSSERVCRFSSELMFVDGGDRLRPEARAALRELASALDSGPASGLNLLIVGHSYGPGQVTPEQSALHPTDWHLTAHQAIAVEQYLEEARLSPLRMGIVSYAGYQPLVTGRDEAARKKNARLEIFLLPPDPPR